MTTTQLPRPALTIPEPAEAPADGTTLVHRLIEARAKRTPHALAATAGRERLTYRDLNARANRLARTLRAAGVRTEQPVALLMERSLEMLVGFLAVLKSGGAAVLLDPGHPDQRLRTVAAATRPRLVLTLEYLRRRLPELPAVLLDTDRPEIDRQGPDDLNVPVHLDNLAYLVHTSGSTGEPKRVGVLHRSVAHSIATHQAGHRITADDRAAWISPPGSSAVVGEIWPYLAAGASVHAAPAGIVADVEDLRDWLLRYAVTKAFLPMPLAELMVNLDWPADTDLRLVTIGSDTVRRWASASLPFEVAVSCGSAEANGVTSSLVPWDGRLTNRTATAADRAGLPPVGRPWPDVRLHLLDAALRAVPPGAIGEICVDSPELARGYLGAAGLTADRFVPNPYGRPGTRLYRTGDLGRIRSDGHLEHHGRTDRDIKIRGFRVSPAEIEAELLKLPGIRDAAVVAVEGGTEGADRRLVGYVVADPRPDAARIVAYLAERLPAYLVPAAVTFLDRMPLTPNGKVDRAALPSPDWVSMARCGEHREPRDELEAGIADAFGEVLGRTGVGAEDNFFHLGGDSLTGARLAQRLRALLGKRVPLRVIFQNPTPATLAGRLRA
ncbi:non-ribosomal peptide synthetase [Plantactinospora sp. KLBMP9567]|uniref:non-ribosomal peptide synthetase n=1 Tax=Plantactinospora sp. KLBMP9567 TaxID=3085900 RepID=UPI002980EA97|nr:non-ribosomal peptide synthetase [Plantactinospora sp. KLBMP9567]MDW5322280.1 non-ribosomal peptide synthetase [Plantactinospora sp. KLBMP9567]